MAQRPPGKGGPEEGTPEYEWLYGSKGSARSDDATRMVPTQDRPPETRVMPAQPQPSGSSGRPPGSGRGTPSAAPPPSPARSRPRLPRFRFGFLKLLLLLWLAFMIAVPIWAWSKIDKVDAEPTAGNRPDDQPGTNYLIVGSDKADDLTDEQRKSLGTGPRGGTNTDTIIVLHTGSGPDTKMSIPRDTLTEVPGHGTQMINAAFALGNAPLLVATVEQLTGIHIDHYVELGFGSVINTVDALGGIEVCPKTAMDDPKARLKIKKGCQEVDGETALAYSRSRYVSALGDLDRVGRQGEVIGALGSAAKSPWTFLNPMRYWRVSNASANAIRIDEGMGPLALGRFALAMSGESRTCTMPNLSAPSDPNRIIADPERASAVFEAIIADDVIPANVCTPTGRPKQ
ncbi:MAG: LytR family transcriptional regulator [Nocardioides sp.]|jgi:LCP family protein required for cell wall assembly|uniref:LCP family protein n=1 Tax=Nocardioides sp. TaxID=35761 RepID=UPI002612F26D|nr:LCP family protein [Nocardioides sp.]MCW2835544.1 LytR family transcriptional regulator [Nocardioides sp.]